MPLPNWDMLLALALASFALNSPKATGVLLASDIKGWSAPEKMSNTGGRWHLDEDLPNSARIEYKFVVDGEWMLDPNNPERVDNGVGGENSVWEGPNYKATTWDHPPRKPMQSRTVWLQFGGATHYVRIFTPQTTAKRLPIVIYGDGKGYEERLHAPVILENLIEAGLAKPSILVLVEPNDRMSEYLKSPKAYEEFVTGPLLAEARKVPHASTLASDVVIGGCSLGGYIALKIVEDFPGKIEGGVHSQSGAFQVDRTVTSADALKHIQIKTRLFFDWGAYEQDLTKVNEKLWKSLAGSGLHLGRALTYEGHTWTGWRNRFADGLQALLSTRTSLRSVHAKAKSKIARRDAPVNGF